MIFDVIDEFTRIVPMQNTARKVFEQIENGKGTLSVKEIASNIEKNQTDVSTMLTRLTNAGFITCQKDGKTRYYSVHPDIKQKEDLLNQFLQKNHEP